MKASHFFQKFCLITFFAMFSLLLPTRTLYAEDAESTENAEAESTEDAEKKSKYKYIVGPNVGKKAYVPKKYRVKLELSLKKYKLPWIVVDRNGDGLPDTATLVNKRNFKQEIEVMDGDYDDTADDFSFYNDDGQIVFQIIDHNKDGNPDLWINIKDGRYVQRFQRDKDGDGLVDIDRVFDASVFY